MSKDPEELELEALQRRLDAAFSTTRPRRGFEDELWARIQRRRPFGVRLRDLMGGFSGGRRNLALPLGGVAVILVAVIGVGLLGSGALFHSRGSSYAASAPQAGGADRNFNTVPAPALHPGYVSIPAPPGINYAGQPVALEASNLYFGAANLQWSGTFPTTDGPLPVLVYTEPSSSEKAADLSQSGPFQGLSVQTFGSVAQLPREPVYVVAEQNPGVQVGTDPVLAATQFLSDHNLLPSWQFTTSVHSSGAETRVLFEREVDTGGGGSAYLVDWTGDHHGIEVDIVNGTRVAIGPLPLSLQPEQLPLISNSEAAQDAVTEPPASQQALNPIPTVKLDHVELVYALAIAGNNGFYEPAYLFSGTFAYNGQTYTKRLLVPLVAALRS